MPDDQSLESPDGDASADVDERVDAPRNWRPRQAPPTDAEFDWRGWVLVAVIVVSFLVVPAAILALPYAQDVVASLGLSLRDAYLALPMIPAILLAVTAVWAALRTRGL